VRLCALLFFPPVFIFRPWAFIFKLCNSIGVKNVIFNYSNYYIDKHNE
jgi:hypothetical protein